MTQANGFNRDSEERGELVKERDTKENQRESETIGGG